MVITYWPLTNALISTYTLPYLRIVKKNLAPGSQVFLFTLSAKKDRENSAFRQIQESLRGEGIISVDHQYRPFGPMVILQFAGITFQLLMLTFRKNVTHLHAWCTPGGAIGWLLSVLTGKPLIVDSFEPHAETMVETGTWKRGSLSFKILFALEKRQCAHATELICAAPGMMGYAARTYGVVRPEKYLKPACVDLEKFGLSRAGRSSFPGLGHDAIVCVYAGKFGGIYLEKETFDFFAVAQQHWPGRFRVLLLTAHSDQEISGFCSASGVQDNTIVKRFVPHSEVAQYMAMADFAICPVKPIPTKKYCSPIKDGEYWALGLPVVITQGISNDSEIIEREKAGAVLQELNSAAYENALLVIDQILSRPEHRIEIRRLAERYRNFSIAEDIYRAIYG